MTIKRDVSFFTKQTCFPLLSILAGLLVMFFPVIFLNQTLFYRDISMQDLPFIEFVKQSLHQGEWPWWNPYVFGGFPQMASLQPPLFYPFTWIYFVLPFASAMGLFLVLHYFIAAFGVYGLGLYWQLSRPSALLAAVLFSLNACLFELNSLQFMLIAVAWMPFVFWGVECYLDQPDRRHFCFVVLFVALEVATGRLDFVYFSALLALLQWGRRLFVATPLLKTAFKGGVALGSAFGLALLLWAIQVIPSLDFIFSTHRGTGVDLAEAQLYSLNPGQLLLLFFNNLCGNNYWDRGWSPLVSSDIGFLIYNLYVGVPAALLVMYAVIKKTPQSLFLLVLMGLFLVVALGKYTPLYALLHHYLPGFSAVRFPIKFMVFVCFFGALLAGMGLEQLLSADKSHKWMWGASSGIGVFLWLLVAGVYGYQDGLLRWFQSMSLGTTITSVVDLQTSIASSALVTTVFVGGAWLWVTEHIKPMALAWGLVILVAMDLTAHNRWNLWTVDQTVFEQKPALAQDLAQWMGDKRLYRFIKPLENVVPLVERSKRLSDLRTNLATLNSNIGLRYGLADAYGYYPGEPASVKLYQRLNSQAHGQTMNRLLKAMGVRFYLWHVGNRSLTPPDERYFSQIKTDDPIVEVWEVKGFKSRFSFATQAFVASSDDETLAALVEPEQFSLEPDAVILQDKDLKLAPLPHPPPAQAAIQLLQETNNTLHLRVTNPHPGYLVLANAYNKGWQVEINGEAQTIHPANFYHQAVFLQAGHHTLRFSYQPPYLKLSFCLTLMGWVIFLACYRHA